MNLKAKLLRRIRTLGPMSIAEFMTSALYDPEDGYYARRPNIGPAGDFVTAPEVSQMFGELLGLWAAETWRCLGSPPRITLLELGPGRGALMADALRAGRAAHGFLEAARIVLLEASAPLRAIQEERLAGSGAVWIRALDEVPDGAPLLVIANEFLDCLPIRQFVRAAEGWRERVVCEGPEDGLAFGLAPMSPLLVPEALRAAPVGAVAESAQAQAGVVADLAGRIVEAGGAALFLDYGRDRPETGDTLQALRAHARKHPLEDPGEADLTAHVDFPACVAAARVQGAIPAPILSQGAFLLNLGLDLRARALLASRPEAADTILRQRRRLAHPEEMGSLFKAFCLHSKGLEPPGFEDLAPAFAALDDPSPAL